MRHSYFVPGARPVASYGDALSPVAVIHSSVPTARYDSAKESPPFGAPSHESVAVVSSMLPSSTFKLEGAAPGCTRTRASLLSTSTPS